MKKTLSLVFVTLALTTQAQIVSTFDTDVDGWSFLNASNTLNAVDFNATNGNPGGYGSASYASNQSASYQYWTAPAKFLGNHLVKSLGMTFKFDIQQSPVAGTTSFGNTGDIRIETSSGALVYALSPKPALAPAWSSYSFTLDETGGWRWNATNGALATRDQIKNVLRNITAIKIRGTYVTNASNISGIDNVVLEQRVLTVAPAVTSFSPLSGEPGTSLTISGNNFDPTASNNVVYFGTIKATISSASSSQLIVNIPVGAAHEKITVVNKTTGLSNTSSKPFTPVFKGGGRIIPSSFGARVDFATIQILGMFVADIDGDGWPDLTVTNNITDNVIDIYRNLGLGGELSTASFAPKVSVPTLGIGAVNGAGLKFADLDGDGKPDAVTSNPTGPGPSNGSFVTLRNISTPGNIAFETAEYWAVSYQYASPIALVTDVDGDGRPELIAGSGSCTCVEINFWINQNLSSPGDIEFGPSVAFFNSTVINGSRGTASDDMDGDGKNDLVVSAGNGYVFLRNISTPGVPAFEHSFTIPVSQTASVSYDPTITISDFNLDGKNDIAWKDYGGPGDVHIRLNTDTNGILEATDFATEVLLNGDLSGFGGITITDFNGDGKPDIAAADDSDIGVFENIYSGGVFDANAFVSAYQVTGGGASTYPSHPVARDLNGDNKPDLIFAVSSGRLSILENKNIHTPIISVNTVSPLAGPIGSTVTITGNNFSTIASENRVWFGGIEANVISATAIEIKAEVPAGAGYERVSVVRNKLTSYYHLPFNVTFSPGVIFDGTSFLPPVTLPLTTADYDVEVADLNNDGKPDVVADSDVSFFNGVAYRNVHTTGAITSASFILDDTTSTSAQDLKLMDVDADGKPDILSSGGMYKNSSTTTEINFEAVAGLNNIRFGSWADFNLDGMIDIVTIITNTGNVSIYENRYRGYGGFLTGTFATFSAASTLAKPAINGSVVSGDFDNDGLADLVSTNPGTDNISIWRNTSAYRIAATQFTSVGNINAGDVPGRLYSSDLDLDGKMDLMLYHGAGTNSTLISVFHNQSTTGNIVFNKVDFTIPAAATVAHIRDLDGDGKPEIIVTSESTDQFFILKNTAAPGTINASSFAVPFTTAVNNPRGLTTGDLNADGKPEIIIASAPNSLLVFENVVPTGPTISISSQPTSTAVCDGTTTSFMLTATGTTNLTYQWQKFDGSVFNNVTNTGGYSGTITATLSINTTGNFGAGDYRCLIKGDLAPDKFSNTVTLTVNVVPAAPTGNGNSNCIPAAITLTASGGSNGQYRWYDVATGGTAISGQVNSSYTTPVITTTTTYHVAINNGFCESSRTPVIATIAPIAKPTLTSSVQALGGTINLCTGDVLTINAPSGFTNYIWSNGGNTNPITINSSTSSLTLQVVDGAGCTSPVSDALNIVVNPYPVATITPTGIQLTASAGDSYQWHQNGVVVVGATNQNFDFNFLEYGLYVVDVTDNGCTSTSLPFEYLITGFEKNTEGLKVYPNPVEENLFVEFKPPYTIQVMGVTGNVIQNLNAQSTPSSIDFSSMAKGIYFLKIKNENQTQYLRIIKK
ncbi:MAG TPA: FG-GAP-like repeat-containing protein [Chryseolinea sp.]|nr:FG-GAP-like repeat-containing protein [Chryseolinea sp.]